MNRLTKNDDAGASPPSARPEVWRPELTMREREVMGWLACGKTDAEIAALMAISPRTVQKHLEHVYVKLGVETRTAAVMRLLATREDERNDRVCRLSRSLHSKPHPRELP